MHKSKKPSSSKYNSKIAGLTADRIAEATYLGWAPMITVTTKGKDFKYSLTL